MKGIKNSTLRISSVTPDKISENGNAIMIVYVKRTRRENKKLFKACANALHTRHEVGVVINMFDSPVYSFIGFFATWWILIALICKTLRCVRVHLLPKLTRQRIDLVKKYGAWAVVTGSTDGIGKAYAMELAKRGINIILISRNVEKLNHVAEEIILVHLLLCHHCLPLLAACSAPCRRGQFERLLNAFTHYCRCFMNFSFVLIGKMYNVNTKIIRTDFSQGFSIYKQLEKDLDNLPVGILVNNLSMFFSHPLYFTEVPPKMIDVIVNININSALIMTRILLPRMQMQRKGAIIFLSSISELSSHPLNTLYSSTKRFIRSFSEGLQPDCNKFGITVQRLTPSLVKTRLNLFTRRLRGGFDNFLVPNPEMYASAAISTLGRSNVTCGFWPHELQYFLTNLLPRALSDRANERFALQFKNDYLRKQKQKIVGRNSMILRV